MIDYVYNSRSKILEVKVSGDINSIESTTEAVKKSLKRYKIIKEAILVDKPFATAIAKIFQLFNSKIENYSFEVFSTEDASRNWLL
jgi:hypothetical protein